MSLAKRVKKKRSGFGGLLLDQGNSPLTALIRRSKG